MAANDDRTEKPTPKHRRDQRKKGVVTRSPELLSWAAVMASTFLVQLTVSMAAGRFRELMDRTAGAIEEASPAGALEVLGRWAVGGLLVCMPLGLGLMGLGLVLNYAQVGWWPSGSLLKPKFSRISPKGGLKRLFGVQTAFGSVKELAKLLVVGYLAYRAVIGVVPALIDSGRLSIPAATSIVASSALALVRQVAALGMVVAAVDYWFQRKQSNKQLLMSRHMMKEEHKQQEGDPLVKQAIRQRQYAISQNRMMAAVAHADVVLVNPTHVAVALRYDSLRGGAPRVVAKGAGVVATKIKERAAEHGIPLVQDIPLARTIYRLCDLNDEIPADLYDAVARLLAFIYGLKARGMTTGVHNLGVSLLGEHAPVPA